MLKTARQDRQGVRTFGEVMGFATDAQKDASQAKKEAEAVSEKMKPEEIFRLLTNDGKSQGLYRGDDGNLYVNGEYIQAGTFTSKAEVYINPGVEEFETVKNHVLKKETIPANRIALYDTDGSGGITITDMLAFKAAMLGKETIANWPNAVKTNITVTVDAKNIEKTVKISGTNMWGRHIEFYIGLNGGNIGRHDGNLAVNGLLSINGDITLLADGSRSVITGLTDPVEDSDAVNKAYVDKKSDAIEIYTDVVTQPSGGNTITYPFTYRIIKKPNGIAEIIGTSDEFETSITKAWGNLFESKALTFPVYGITLTSVLFCQTSFISSSHLTDNPIAWTEGCRGNDVTSPGVTYLCRADAVQGIKGKLCSYTVGTWK